MNNLKEKKSIFTCIYNIIKKNKIVRDKLTKSAKDLYTERCKIFLTQIDGKAPLLLGWDIHCC